MTTAPKKNKTESDFVDFKQLTKELNADKIKKLLESVEIPKELGDPVQVFEPDSKPNIISGNSNTVGSNSSKLILKLLEMLDKRDRAIEQKDKIIERKDALIEKLMNKL